jgi:hypothetical protein
MDALQARDILNGKRVDVERGSIIKVEMAKKNLYAKRGFPVDFAAAVISPVPNGGLVSAFTPLVPVGPLMVPMIPPSVVNPVSSQNTMSNPSLPVGLGNTVPVRKIIHNNVSAKDLTSLNDSYYLGSPVPRELLGGPSSGTPFASSFEFYSSPPPEHESTTATLSRRGSPSSDSGNISDGNAMSNSIVSLSNSNMDLMETISRPGSTSLLNGGGGNGTDSPIPTTETLTPSLPALKAISSRQNSTSERGFSSALFSSESLLASRLPPSPLTINTSVSSMSSSPIPSNNLGGNSMMNGIMNGNSNSGIGGGNGNGGNGNNGANHNNNNNGGIISPLSASAPMSPTTFTNPGYRCIADYNPPCNTLYVGNLPTNTNEHELREMFVRCPGFKRLCFRSRPSGVMCFVEFEDVTCANQALQNLHGAMLSNSVKGGIRLSFSKNPLGVRAAGNMNLSPAQMMLMSNFAADKESGRMVFSC